MTLSFQTKWPERMGGLAGQPNYFIEKIWAGLNLYFTGDQNAFDGEEDWDDGFWEENVKNRVFSWEGTYHVSPKLHTIRHDPHNRWKPGMKIHFVINNRTKNRFQFAPVIGVKNVQKIEIKYWNRDSDFPLIIIDNYYEYHAYEKDGYSFMEQLALNDGFPSVEAFFQYFNEDFTGKIIHWTDLKY